MHGTPAVIGCELKELHTRCRCAVMVAEVVVVVAVLAEHANPRSSWLRVRRFVAVEYNTLIVCGNNVLAKTKIDAAF